ncbi:hypothetical protein EYF80_056859 [Liparis tanakae]|uniref:Uncharacterized protein n=1 Tax=Liparis tanakae TaxID=230148 RepID=A0A4Z2EVS3_9TELE|nr:hypothetical protein EYF80_056859 [Liparis tanakae]
MAAYMGRRYDGRGDRRVTSEEKLEDESRLTCHSTLPVEGSWVKCDSFCVNGAVITLPLRDDVRDEMGQSIPAIP